jgi:hypothetical protein
MSIEESLKKDKSVVAQFYKDGKLWYRTASGLEYPAPPIDQKGDAAYFVQSKMMQFWR